jgi:hypothetical protein
VLNIGYRKNDCKMIVTMVAHRGWRPDDKTVYYIATYATPKTPADMIGEPYVQSDEKLIGMPVEWFRTFRNVYIINDIQF